MVKDVVARAPSINKATLIMTGATEIRKAFPPEQQAQVIAGYMEGLKVVFAMAIAATGIATVFGLGTRWKKLKQENLTGGMA